MRQSPWMPLYCDDLIASCADMSSQEFGGYVRLLCYIWSRGPVPNNLSTITRIGGISARCWRRIECRFSPTPMEDGSEGLSQTRIEAERFKRYVKSEERVTSGRKGAVGRWGKPNGSAIGSANGSANGSAIQKPMANRWHATTTTRNRTSTASVTQVDAPAPRLAPPLKGGGLPRLSADEDPSDDTAAINRAFIAQHRARGGAR